jgi:homospermidine synthase
MRRETCPSGPQFGGVRFGLIGFGSIGRALAAALIARHGVSPSDITALVADTQSCVDAAALGVRAWEAPVTRATLQDTLPRLGLQAGDVLVQVALDVSSEDVIAWCQARAILYLDTWLDPWGVPLRQSGTVVTEPNWPLRERLLRQRLPAASTAVVCHGANPGLVSHFVRPGLLGLAHALSMAVPKDTGLGELGQMLGVHTIHIAEHDTQEEASHGPADAGSPFCLPSTWAPESLATEAFQAAEVAWGTREATPPHGWRPVYPDSPTVTSDTPGLAVRVKTWTPVAGEVEACVLPHFEAFSIADALTVVRDGRIAYRPTVHYAYRPAPAVWDALNRWRDASYPPITRTRLLRDGIVHGVDALGLLFTFAGGSYWHGSTVAIDEARALIPEMNATGSQVVGALVGAITWLLANPRCGIVEPESLDSEVVMRAAAPYLGRITGHLTPWTPSPGSDLTALRLGDFFMQGKEHADEKTL